MIFFGYEFIIRKVQPEVSVKEIDAAVALLPKTKAKDKKPKKKRHRKCFYKDKVMYTREEAADAMKHIKNPQIRIYCCEFCSSWHLTHKRLKHG